MSAYDYDPMTGESYPRTPTTWTPPVPATGALAPEANPATEPVCQIRNVNHNEPCRWMCTCGEPDTRCPVFGYEREPGSDKWEDRQQEAPVYRSHIPNRVSDWQQTGDDAA